MIMKKNILLRTNLLVCAVIVLGFAVSSVISYWSNQGIFLKDVENVSSLTSEGIYYQIESIFTRPVNVSLTMANDNLLKEFLADEEANLRNPSYVETLRDYLNVYRAKYGYDSVFLVSTRTGRYYHFNGLDRVLTPGNLENEWYYAFLKSGAEHSLNIDNDEAARNEITVFINCRITGRDGSTRGVVGVGFRIDHLQTLLDDYEKKFGVAAYLVGEDGNVEVSTERTGYKAVTLFRTPAFAALKARILNDSDGRQMFWYPAEGGDRYLVTQYLPNLHWHLVVENDTRGLTRKLNVQFYRNVLVIVVILVCVLLTITRVIRSYNAQIIRLTRAVEERERKHRAVFQEATEQLYENIYELDITHNRTASEATERYFESLGAALGTPYDECLRIVAGKQIKEEFRQGYLDTFSRENVLRAYREGRNSLQYDLMISSDGGGTYYWIRISTHIFHWDEDDSIRMLVYRQNIDAQKRRERSLFDQMRRDSLTGLCNKAATQEDIRRLLQREPGGTFAFFILDVDKFKDVNDTLGHGAGDAVLVEFARTLREQFREDDVVGRIGGDEFVAFCRLPGREAARKKAAELVAALRRDVRAEAGTCSITASIGVALSPESGREFETLYRNADRALYRTKEKGRNGFTLHGDARATPE